MYCFILISIIIVALSHGQSCTSTCSYIYDNRTGIFTATTTGVKELYRNLTATTFRTGVYTVLGQFSCSQGKIDHLRFRKLNNDGSSMIYQPLVMKVSRRNAYAEFYAQEKDSRDRDIMLTSKQTLKSWKSETETEMSLQISDHVQDSYSIYLNTHAISYNYNNKWNTFINRKLDTINSIYSDLDCIQYKYIMVCDDLTVNICDVSEPSEKLEFGKPYSIGCGGTGSPLLKITWKVQYEFGENMNDFRSSISSQSSVNTDRDDVVKSKIDIHKFSVAAIGLYTCTVTNKNYGNKASHTFTLSYTKPPKVTISSSPKFYKTPNLPLSFTWNIIGWPLENIKAECTSTGPNSRSQDLVANKNRIDKDLMNFLIFQWNITSPTNATRIYCSITNNGEEIYSNTITRVGHSCIYGAYGEKDKCIPCPKGKVSPPQAYEHDQCYYENSFCLAGMYGVGYECSNCPAGTKSEDFAVKIQECFDRSGVSLGIIIGGSVGVFMLIIGVVIGIVCLRRMRRGKGIIRNQRNKEVDINLSLNVNSKGQGYANPDLIAKQDSEPLYVENTIQDPDSALYAQVDHSSRNRKKHTPQDELVYSEDQNENATYVELDRSTTKRRAPNQSIPETIYSSTMYIQNDMIYNE